MNSDEINEFINNCPDPQKAVEVLSYVAQMNYRAGYRAAATCQPIMPVDPPKKAS